MENIIYIGDEFFRKYQGLEAYGMWKKGLDVQPHPELPVEEKYEFMLRKFNDVSEENIKLKEVSEENIKLNPIQTGLWSYVTKWGGGALVPGSVLSVIKPLKDY